MRTPMIILFILAGTLGVARAQTFPADDQWTDLDCGDHPMNDSYRDESGAIDERDLIGTAIAPAGFRAADADYLYLRLRLDEDPAPGGALRPFSWGWELDVDGDLTTYEILVLVDGVTGGAGAVRLFENTTVTLPDDPSDPADQPELASYAIDTSARSLVAADSTFGIGVDYFLDAAVPWADLTALGLEPADDPYVWAASSSSDNSLNGDFACHNGATGEPTLDGIADPVDPNVDTDGDGFTDQVEVDAGTDPNDPNDFPMGGRLEGGGGCRAAGGDVAGWAAALLLLALLGRRKRPGYR